MLVLNLAAAAGWWWVYRGLTKTNDRIGVLNREISLADAKQKNIRLLHQTLQSIERDKSRVDAVFVDEHSVVRFIENLEELAALSGVELEISSAALPVETDEGGPIFNLSIKGGFGRLFRFFELLEKINFQIRIESASFNIFGSGIWNSQIKLRLLSYQF